MQCGHPTVLAYLTRRRPQRENSEGNQLFTNCEARERTFMRNSRRIIWNLVVGGLLLGGAGCGTHEYQARMSKRLAELHTEVSPNDLYGYFEPTKGLAGDRVNVRIPQAFTTVFNDIPDPQKQTVPDDEILFPKGVRPPGYDRTYVAQHKDGTGIDWSYYLYLGAHLSDNDDIDSDAEEFGRALGNKPFKEIESLTPDRPTFRWKKIRYDGKFFFDKYDAGNNNVGGKSDGTIEIYLCGGNEHVVVLGWKAPTAIRDECKIEKLAELMARSLTIEPPSAQ
jgi:hypothetical protein